MQIYKAIMHTDNLFVMMREMKKDVVVTKFKRIGDHDNFTGMLMVEFYLKDNADIGLILMQAFTDFSILDKKEKKEFLENIRHSKSDVFQIESKENNYQVLANHELLYNFEL